MSDDWIDAGPAGSGCGWVALLIFGIAGIVFFILKALGVITI